MARTFKHYRGLDRCVSVSSPSEIASEIKKREAKGEVVKEGFGDNVIKDVMEQKKDELKEKRKRVDKLIA